MAQFERLPPGLSSEEDDSSETEILRRQATLFDAVAGKIIQSGFHGPKAEQQKRANQSLRPDEVLFKQVKAPTRYEETDYYFAHRNLPKNQKLPSGDLLSALHAYISKLYSRSQLKGDPEVFKCMDETALIALGILMEETVKEELGETGDLTLVEAARSDEERALAHDSEGLESPLTRDGKDSGRERQSEDDAMLSDVSASGSSSAPDESE